MSGLKQEKPPGHRAAQVALAYSLIAGLWIALTDWLVREYLDHPGWWLTLDTLKGLGFVAVTAIALFFLLRAYLRADELLITRIRDQQTEIQALSQFREGVIESAHVWINGLDPAARVTLWNAAAERISGYHRDEVIGSDQIWALLYPDPDYRQQVTETASKILTNGDELEQFETTIRAKDGSKKIIAWDSRQIRDQSGAMSGSVAVGRDITLRHQMEQALAARERELATLISNLPGMAYRALNDDDWTVQFASNGCEELTGYTPDELTDNRVASWASLIHPDDAHQLPDVVNQALTENRPFAIEYRIIRRDGKEVWCWEKGCAVTVDGEEVLEGIIMDITERKHMEQELACLAGHDPLTGLLNRREFNRLLQEELKRSKRYRHTFAILWVDIDKFKMINDRYGHLGGDTVLKEISAIMKSTLRDVDSVSRYGGDELAAILPELGLSQAMEAAERLRAAVAEYPFEGIDNEATPLRVSIGVAYYPAHGQSVEALCSAADRAMYHVKKNKLNQVCSVDDLSG